MTAEPFLNSEIIFYQTKNGHTRAQCHFADENLWLRQEQIGEPFETTPQNVALHLKDIFPEGELVEAATCMGYLQIRSSERVVTHARVREMMALHPFDLTRMLQDLVREGFLEAHNPGRRAVYCLPGAALPKPEEVFGDGSEQSILSSAHLTGSSAHLTGVAAAEEHRDAEGRLLADQLDAPVIDSLERLVPAFREGLEKLAIEPRTKGKLPVETMKQVVLTICSGHYVTLSCVAQLVNRDSDAFRQQYLKPLAKDGKLRLAFPTAPTHAKQAYRSAD